MKALGAAAAALTLCLLAAAPAHAQTPQPDRTFSTAEECMQSGTNFLDPPPSCTSTKEGVWVAHYSGSGLPGSLPGAGWFVVFIVIALLWGITPAVISGFIASSRGQSVFTAVLLGLILGWIGLLIVVLAFKPNVVEKAKGVVSEVLQPAAAPEQPHRDTTARLTELEDLSRRGLITQEEYTARRAAILEQI